MSFKFACPHCGQRISAVDEDIGTIGGCPSCGEQFRVPHPPPPGPTFLTPPPQRAHTAPPWVNEPRIKYDKDENVKPRRGLSVLALVLSIFPVLNLVGFAMGIVALVRSDREGRRGERGLAVCASVVCGLLILPVNISAYFAAGPFLHLRMPGMVEFKPVHEIPDFVVDDHLAKPTASKATSKIVEPKHSEKPTPTVNPRADFPGIDAEQKPGNSDAAPSALSTEIAPK